LALKLDIANSLPDDRERALLVGRAWLPGAQGPAVIALRGESVIDISAAAPTCTELMSADDPTALAREAEGPEIASVADLLANSAHDSRDPAKPWLLAPVDLQAVKAAGVTFVTSLLERVIEEQAKGVPSAAEAARHAITAEIGGELSELVPGSDAAARLKAALIERGLWSQYLEVGIGPDAEIFTKSQPMSSVGSGAEIGIHPASVWNNPEPELVLVVDGTGRMTGATLGNDVNLRDFEGRSALLLSKAKDNNASCAIGPLIRLFDDEFTLDDARNAEIALKVDGTDGFSLEGMSSIGQISRDPADLVGQTIGANHQYPDGFALFLGTMFAPIQDRDAPGEGFTHKLGDVVTISTPALGALINRVNHSDKIAPWRFGAAALMRNLADRGLLGG
jgi:fumarylacetoacetate (FAA) hydrolase family protein